MSNFLPLSTYRNYLDGDDLLPRRFETMNCQEFVDFLLDGRCKCGLLATCLSLQDYLKALRRFGPTDLFLTGEIVEKPYQIVRGRVYVRLAGGFSASRKASREMRRGEPSVHVRTRTPAEIAEEAKRMLTAHSRLYAEHADIDSKLDKYKMERILPLPVMKPVIRLRDPFWKSFRSALENYCDDEE